MLVRMFQPTMVQKAFLLARIYEVVSTYMLSDSTGFLANNKGFLGAKLRHLEKIHT